MFHRRVIYLCALGVFFGMCARLRPCDAAEPVSPNNSRARRFVEQYEKTVRPLEIAANLAYWTANVTGKEEDFRKKEEAENRLDLCLSDRRQFDELKAIKEGGIADPRLARQITVLYLRYLSKQLDPKLLKEISAAENAAQRKFNVFRPKLDGNEVTDNQIRRILRESTDSRERKAAWEASKRVGKEVIKDLLRVVALRNRAARKLGFANYHVMQLYLGEQDQAQLLKLFDELDRMTREPYHLAKADLDAVLASLYGITPKQLRPWHYHDPFFQEAPDALGDFPKSVYKPLKTVEVCRSFYDGIGLPVDGVLAHSSLYEKPGKNPHAFCIDIDRVGDVRVLANVVFGREWLDTMLHELGHAVYSEYVDPSLPYVLHTEAHTLCTEGVAMMYERFNVDADWLSAMGAKISNPSRFRAAAARWQCNRMLIFSRFCQVMFRFEVALYERAEMYADPERDLSRLWWDLVEKYQEVPRPEGRCEPDYAAKYHIIGAPAYYHNYLLGEMFASQIKHAMARDVFPPGTKPTGAAYVNNRAAGDWMRQRVFGPGATLNWNQLTRHATGEDLNPKAFAEDISASR